MVENRCSRCGVDVEYTVSMFTNKSTTEYDLVRVVEQWCLRCLLRQTPVMGQREGRSIKERIERNKELVEEYHKDDIITPHYGEPYSRKASFLPSK